jgi:hypothetical protein
MGKFKCSCGYYLGRTPAEPGTQYVLVPDEEAEDIFAPSMTAGARDEMRAIEFYRWPNLTICPNCSRVHLEGFDDGGRIRVYQREETDPRIWADFTERDEVGRIVLTNERSLRDIAEQHLLLNPPLRLVLYNDEGKTASGEAHFGFLPDGNLDESTWAVVLDEVDDT